MAELNELQNQVELTINGNDYYYSFETLGINFNSTETEILNAVEGIIAESGNSLIDPDGNFSYTVRKAINTQKIAVYPKPGVA
jgi:hypothetical protein